MAVCNRFTTPYKNNIKHSNVISMIYVCMHQQGIGLKTQFYFNSLLILLS